MLSGPDPYATAVDQFKYIVFGKPDWNWRTFDLERDVAAADAQGQGTLASVDPDLSAFAQHGGKLLMYHGWSDQDIAPRASINFYRRTLAATHGMPANAAWVRLFMVPGMGHCGGGEGPNTFDMMTALEPWVERGTVPERIIASRITAGRVERTRPLCAYPRWRSTPAPAASTTRTASRARPREPNCHPDGCSRAAGFRACRGSRRCDLCRYWCRVRLA